MESYDEVAAFYSDYASTVLELGQSLPSFLVNDWTVPLQQTAALWFYKRVTT